MAEVGRVVAGGIVVAVLAGCAASAPATRPSLSATAPAGSAASAARAGRAQAVSSARGRAAAAWDVDGDGRRDRARLVYLGGYGPGNWELVVDMTTLGHQAVRFTGSPALPGNTATPAIAGAADADRDGHAEIFVKADSGASTQSWAIFKLSGRQIRQVTSQGRPVRLAVGGSVTHQSGFRCDGARLVIVSEGAGPPRYTTWTWERDTYAWSGAVLVPVSRRAGQVTSAQPGSPPAAYSGVGCGDLPRSL
jgi:hypothetical protein